VDGYELYDAEGYGLYDASYFEQLTIEVQDEAGRWVNPQRKRNEATDIRVYALAAHELCPRDVDKMRQPLYHTANTIEKRQKRRRRVVSRGVEV
jgi:phage terminase large subunit GpA-like protein